MSWYLERMAFAREALSEGLCPLCGARLSPYVEGSEHGGYCAEHGRFTVDCDMWHHTTPAGLFLERQDHNG